MSVKTKTYNVLRKLKKKERALEKRVSKALRPNTPKAAKKKPKPKTKPYVHPWTLQDIGNPTIVDQLKKEHCCGCESCANACPVNAITMMADEEGFLYPHVDHDKCIKCGLCVKKCPVICDQHANDEVDTCYATIANDTEMRMRSSSGGLFTQFARFALDQGGVVFGAAYKTFDTVGHTWVESEEDLDALRRSKYVQSSTGDSYKQAKAFLDEGRVVLYTGCPCQIAGLYAYLGKSYENLYTMDLLCHGVPSPALFRRYLREEYGDKAITDVNFRDKAAYGWSTHMNVYFEDGKAHRDVCGHDPYYRMFLPCLAMRPFCSHCKFTKIPRVADVSVGDWWGIEKYDASLNDQKGTSLLIVNNEHGRAMFDAIASTMERCEEYPISAARPRNYTIDRPFKANAARKRFFELLEYQSFSKSVRSALDWHYDVGIYGLWYGENYGSILTYYGLRQVLRSMGLSSVVIANPHFNKKCFTLEPYTFAERNGYFMTKHRDFGAMRELNSICDTFLLGSDQLWNPFLSRPYRFTYFLDFVKSENKRIAYGTSFGKDTHKIDDAYRTRSALELSKFDALSVRDDFSRKLLKEQYGGLEATKVLDPALLCDPEDYYKLANIDDPYVTLGDTPFEAKDGYIFAYILDPTPETRQSLIELSHTCHLPILLALDYGPKKRAERQALFEGSDSEGVFVLDTPSCEHWLRGIRDSRGVLTDSFHGTIFSYVFKRQFVSVPNVRRGQQRFTDLLEILGLTDRMLAPYIGNEEKVCDMIFNCPIDYEASNALLEKQREASRAWLENALFSPKEVHVDRAYKRVETCDKPQVK